MLTNQHLTIDTYYLTTGESFGKHFHCLLVIFWLTIGRHQHCTIHDQEIGVVEQAAMKEKYPAGIEIETNGICCAVLGQYRASSCRLCLPF